MTKSIVFALSVLALAPAQALAQEENLAGMVKRLFDSVTPNAIFGGVNHQSHFFLGGENLTLATRQLNVAIAAQLASFPLASSSGGFTFGVNERGEIVPTSTTFGPSFAERAVTIGRNKFNFGYTFQRTSYDSFEGLPLDSGELRFISQHNNCCPAGGGNPQATTDFFPEFERDLLLSTLFAEIDTNTSAFFANYGVTNRFDVGLAFPIVNVKVDAAVRGDILRTATAASPQTHSFDGLGSSVNTVFESGSATGLGDILLRAKYNLYRTETSAFAAALDLRLPTGNEDDLLGTGATQAQAFFVASGEYGRCRPHVNIGYTFSHGESSADAGDIDDPVASFGAPAAGIDPDPLSRSVPDEFNYTFGINMAPHPLFTLGFDMRGRTLRDVPRFVLQNTTYMNRGPGAVLPTTSFTAEDEFIVEMTAGNVNLLLGVVGAKINLASTLLLNITLLFPMSDDGLKPKPTPVIGFDYVF